MKKIILTFLFLMISVSVFAKGNSSADISSDEIEKKLLQYADIKEQSKNISDKKPISDELIDKKYTLNISSEDVFKVTISKNSPIIKNINDELMSQGYIDNAKTIRIIGHKKDYDFSQKTIPIKIKIAKDLNYKNYSKEGDVIPFVATHDFVIGGKTYEKGTNILGRIENISASDKMGVPETINIDNFYIDVNNDSKYDNDINLHGYISKAGANRSIWVYPLYQAGNLALYAAGFILVPIHGGRVKISQNEEFTLFYESSPEVKQTVSSPSQKAVSENKKKTNSSVKKKSKNIK